MTVTLDLTHPGAVMRRLAEIEDELAHRQNAYEDAAHAWFVAKHEAARAEALVLLSATDATVTERKARARAALDPGLLVTEAKFEALRRKVDVLETRANICMSLLKAHGRI